MPELKKLNLRPRDTQFVGELAVIPPRLALGTRAPYACHEGTFFLNVSRYSRVIWWPLTSKLGVSTRCSMPSWPSGAVNRSRVAWWESNLGQRHAQLTW